MSQDKAPAENNAAVVEQSLLDIVEVPDEVRIDSTGETVTVKPIKFGKLPSVLKYIHAIMRFADEEGNIDIKEAFMKGGEEILAIMGIVINKQRSWFDEIDLPEGVELLAVIVRQNVDFFVQNVLPQLQGVTARLTESTEAATAAPTTGPKSTTA